MNTRTISLDIDKRHAVREPITIAQGDRNGTTIAATIYDGGTLVTTSGLSVRFRMRLPDGRHFYEKTATWNAASGTATVTIDETQAASAPGTTSEAYFELLSGTTVIHSTSRFSVRVLRSATEGFDPATSYSDRVEELLDDLDELPLPGNAAPVMDGTASVGTSGRYARQDHRHPIDTSRASTAVATTSANGLMSATDKAKLDGIAANANAYELLPATASALGGVKPDGTTITVDSDGTIHGASTYELPTMSASTKGGAKLGDGLALTDGALGIDPESQESTGEVRGAVSSLTAKGWATQDGTPTTSSPVPIQVARGRNLLDLSGMVAEPRNCTTTVNGDGTVTITKTANVECWIGNTITTAGDPWDDSFGNAIAVAEGATLTLSLQGTANRTLVTWLDSDKRALSYEAVNGTYTATGTFSMTVPSGARYAGFRIGCNANAPQTTYVVKAQLERGSTAHNYLPYGDTIGIDITHDGTTTTIPVPLPSKGYAASLPDGTADVLTIDGAGKVEWGSAVGHIESYAGESVGAVYLSTTGSLTTGAEVYYPLATPTTEQCGYIDWPTIPDGAVVTCPELDALGVRYLIGNSVAEMARDWYERAKSEYEGRISALEQAVAELATA